MTTMRLRENELNMPDVVSHVRCADSGWGVSHSPAVSPAVTRRHRSAGRRTRKKHYYYNCYYYYCCQWHCLQSVVRKWKWRLMKSLGCWEISINTFMAHLHLVSIFPFSFFNPVTHRCKKRNRNAGWRPEKTYCCCWSFMCSSRLTGFWPWWDPSRCLWSTRGSCWDSSPGER